MKWWINTIVEQGNSGREDSGRENSGGGSSGGGPNVRSSVIGEPRGPMPEHQFAVWLMRTAAKRTRDFVQALLVGPQYRRLARFSGDMHTCWKSGLDAARSLELCLKPHATTRLGEGWSDAVNQVRVGRPLAEALRGADKYLPPFYLPVIVAGEESGRLDEAFQFLQRHCNLLAGTASAVRKLWLYPLCILLAGSVLQVVLHFILGSFRDALDVAFSELVSILQVGVVVAVVALTPLRSLVDQVRMNLPWIGELEHDLAANRFFQVMGLLYETGDSRVDRMIQTATKSVSNHAARDDLNKAASAIQAGSTIADAFSKVAFLSQDEKSIIEVGEVSGSLEHAFERIADESEARLMAKLALLQPLLNRIVMAVVAFSIVSTLFALLM